MHWIIILQLIASIGYVAYLIHWYTLKSVGWFVKISVYFTWLICFSNVVLLPYDIYFSLQHDYAMSVVWKTSYFLIFFLTWLLLPIAQEYQSAGQFSIREKLKRAVINNLIIYGIFALVGVLGLGYLIISGKVNITNLPPLLLAASNGFGMFLLVIFLSYGIVAIPKSLWRYHNFKLKLKQYQFSVSILSHKKQKIIHELQLKVKQLLWKIKKDGETTQTVAILNLIPQRLLDKWNRNVPDLGHVSVVKVHKDIKQLTLELSRIQSRWEELLIGAFRVQDILTYMNAANCRIQSTIFQHYRYEVLNYLQWFWHCKLKRWLAPMTAVFTIILAVGIIIAEITVFIPQLSIINPFSRILNIKDFVLMDFLLLALLAYMAFCIYYALFKLKFSNFYGLYWNQQTDAASLIFFAINCSRISTALNYNFLQVVDEKESSFVLSMGVIPVFGETLRIIFPVLLIMLILFNTFDIYSKLCKKIGLTKFQFEKQFNHENIDEGRRLLQKARTDLETKILNSNCKNLSEFRSYKSQSATTTIEQTNKENFSSEKLHLQPSYFNQYADMNKVAKIFDM